MNALKRRGNFCPTSAVTRGQMAAFLSGTFFLPL
jgi:hypothetical protein